MRLKYMTTALALHAGLLALAFYTISPMTLQSPRPSFTLNSEVAAQAIAENLTAAESPDRSPIMPNPGREYPTDAPKLEGHVPPPRTASPEPQPPKPLQPREDYAPVNPPRPPVSGGFTVIEPMPVPEPAAASEHSESSKIADRPGFDNVRSADVAPVLLNPQWPNLIRKGFTGQVMLGVVISPEGHAISVEVLQSTGNANWDDQLKEMLLHSAYLPGRTAGKPVLCSQRFRITFRKT